MVWIVANMCADVIRKEMGQEIWIDGCFAELIKCKQVLTADNVKETGKIKILQTTDSIRLWHFYLWRKRAVPASTGDFHVFDIDCTLTLLCQHQIIKGGVRVRGVLDYHGWCQVWLKSWPSSFGEGDLFYQLSMPFHFVIIISPWKRVWYLVWITFVLFTHGIFVASLVKIVVLEKILNVVNSFSLFSIILLWKRM